MNAAAARHVTVWLTPTGTAHSYPSCTGADRHAGHMDKQIMTVAALVEVPAEKVCACLRQRWGAYRQDLGLAPKFKDITTVPATNNSGDGK
jgi:hypothetical protein